MSTARHLWVEQCMAARDIRDRFGVQAAFDYIIGEKLQSFAEAAARNRELASNLPQFVAEARRIFTPEEIETHLARIERNLVEEAEYVGDPDGDFAERPERYQEHVDTFRTIAEFLRAPTLGTS